MPVKTIHTKNMPQVRSNMTYRVQERARAQLSHIHCKAVRPISLMNMSADHTVGYFNHVHNFIFGTYSQIHSPQIPGEMVKVFKGANLLKIQFVMEGKPFSYGSRRDNNQNLESRLCLVIICRFYFQFKVICASVTVSKTRL